MTIQARGKRKVRVGTVVTDKMKKTVVVDVERVYRHRFYGKVVRAFSRCYVHDEGGEARPGDVVRIMECRPISRLKRWRLVEIVKKSKGLEAPGIGEEEVRELQEEIRGTSAPGAEEEGIEISATSESASDESQGEAR
jgi:small subunit ribosomal protein S17